MKTVQDYLVLGVEFVKGDVVLDRKSREYSRDWFRALLDDENTWIDDTIKSFAWRDNDGVKPEYKGAIEVELNSGQKCTAYVSDITWIRGFGSSVAKWRPVVSMCNHTELKPRASFVTAVSIDGPKFTIKEEAPKTTMTVNIEGHDYLLVSHAPAVSPKEDKPMKPVYTAEMHSKGELPPVGAKCIYVFNDDEEYIGEIAAMDGDACWFKRSEFGYKTFIGKHKFKPIIKTIKVNGFDVPAPMSEAPECGTKFYNPSICYHNYFDVAEWIGDSNDNMWLSRGLAHSTKSAAIAHAKAMLGIDPAKDAK